MLLWLKTHKTWTFIIVALIVGTGAFFYFKKSKTTTTVSYTYEQATKGTVIASVSGTGQIESSNQVDLKAEASGKLLISNAVVGQSVKAGTLLFRLDSSEAAKAVRDAQAALASAKLSLEKTQRGTRSEELAITQEKIDLAKQQLETTKEQNQMDLDKTYSDAKTTLYDTYTKIDDLLNRQLSDMFSKSAGTYKLSFLTNDALAALSAQDSRLEADQALNQIRNNRNASTNEAIVSALQDDIKQLTVVTSFLEDLGSATAGGITSIDLSDSQLSSYKNTVTSAKSSISSASDTLLTRNRAITNQIMANQTEEDSAANSIKQQQAQFDLDKSGADPLDLRAQQLAVQQKQNALYDAQEKYADYSVTAPTDGIISAVNVNKGEQIRSGTTLASIISQQQIAKVALNEVDAAKVKVGQKVTLSFDALEDLSISGQVAEVDAAGTVSSGVVSYNIKISLDTQNDQVKPGMTATASIITESRVDVLTVSSGAVKEDSQGNSYVEIAKDGQVSKVSVVVGLNNDTLAEITSGLTEGQEIISKTLDSTSSTKSTTSSSSNRSMLNLGGGAPGGMR